MGVDQVESLFRDNTLGCSQGKRFRRRRTKSSIMMFFSTPLRLRTLFMAYNWRRTDRAPRHRMWRICTGTRMWTQSSTLSDARMWAVVDEDHTVGLCSLHRKGQFGVKDFRCRSIGRQGPPVKPETCKPRLISLIAAPVHEHDKLGPHFQTCAWQGYAFEKLRSECPYGGALTIRKAH